MNMFIVEVMVITYNCYDQSLGLSAWWALQLLKSSKYIQVLLPNMSGGANNPI